MPDIIHIFFEFQTCLIKTNKKLKNRCKIQQPTMGWPCMTLCTGCMCCMCCGWCIMGLGAVVMVTVIGTLVCCWRLGRGAMLRCPAPMSCGFMTLMGPGGCTMEVMADEVFFCLLGDSESNSSCSPVWRFKKHVNKNCLNLARTILSPG